MCNNKCVCVHALYYIGCGRIKDEKGNNTMLCMYVISYACESIKDADVKKENRIRELVEEKHELKQRCVCSFDMHMWYLAQWLYVQDDTESSYSEHLEQCCHHEEEIRKQFNGQVRQLEEDKVHG